MHTLVSVCAGEKLKPDPYQDPSHLKRMGKIEEYSCSHGRNRARTRSSFDPTEEVISPEEEEEVQLHASHRLTFRFC